MRFCQPETGVSLFCDKFSRRGMMRTPFILFVMLIFGFAFFLNAQHQFEEDIISTSLGDLRITFIAHGTLYFTFGGRTIHIDPVGQYADYSGLPKADLILVTHEHGDHLDTGAIKLLSTDKTDLVLTQKCMERIKDEGGIVMKNGDTKTIQGVKIEAVPAYNIKHMRSPGNPFHPKGEGNGYILTFGDKRIYVAGDTENIPEMKELTDIEVAFLPMNLPYTMDPEMAADAAITFKPRILYPYHYGNTDPQELVKLLKDEKDIEVRIRDMK
jgi:L-ascorbate metabolism protein UlaG (beta-lactamase superfamily)